MLFYIDHSTGFVLNCFHILNFSPTEIQRTNSLKQKASFHVGRCPAVDCAFSISVLTNHVSSSITVPDISIYLQYSKNSSGSLNSQLTIKKTCAVILSFLGKHQRCTFFDGTRRHEAGTDNFMSNTLEIKPVRGGYVVYQISTSHPGFCKLQILAHQMTDL